LKVEGLGAREMVRRLLVARRRASRKAQEHKGRGGGAPDLDLAGRHGQPPDDAQRQQPLLPRRPRFRARLKYAGHRVHGMKYMLSIEHRIYEVWGMGCT